MAAFGPFNYPLFLAASKIIPALAAGNTVVAKAPPDAPIPLTMFARVLEEASLPPGVLNVITGPGRDIGNRLASHPDVSMISFTGSSAVGRSIAAEAGPKTEKSDSWPLGDPRAEGTKVGPLLNTAAAEHGLVEDAVAKGARLLRGGSARDAYHEPTVLADVPLDADIMWEETFGPVLTVAAVSDLDEALELSNRSRYGYSIDECTVLKTIVQPA